MHASLNLGYQGKSGPGKIHEVILVFFTILQLGKAETNFFHPVVGISQDLFAKN